MGPEIWRIILFCFFLLIHFSNGVLDCQSQTYQGIQTVPVKIPLPSGSLIENSPGIKFGTIVAGVRVCIPGFRRFQHLEKYAHSRRITVQYSDGMSSAKIELCIHRNASLGLGQCPQHEWRTLAKGLWTGVMSPYETNLIDFRMPDTLFGSLTISVEEESQQYRLVFLALAFAMLILAPSVSKWVPFYYSSAMAFGIIAVVLFLLFQGMKLLPTGRKNTLYTIICGSVVGLGSVIVNYFSGLLHSALQELGFGEDLFNPVAVFVLLFITFIGAWVGYWGVRKLVLSEDGSVDKGTAVFVTWAIRTMAAVMILQSTTDALLAVLMLIVEAILTSALTYMVASFLHSRQRGQLLKNKQHSAGAQFLNKLPTQDTDLLQSQGTTWKWNQNNPHMGGSSLAASRKTPNSRSHMPGSLFATPTITTSSYFEIDKEEDYYSTFHETSERKNFSKKEWDVFTKNSTKKALKQLFCAPEFAEWAAANADRITLNSDKRGKDRDSCDDNSESSTEEETHTGGWFW